MTDNHLKGWSVWEGAPHGAHSTDILGYCLGVLDVADVPFMLINSSDLIQQHVWIIFLLPLVTLVSELGYEAFRRNTCLSRTSQMEAEPSCGAAGDEGDAPKEWAICSYGQPGQR